MNLENPIVVQPNPMRKSDGSFKTLKPITLNKLDFVILDNVNKKICSVRIKPFPTPLVLWSGDDYDNAGDYTQSELEDRLLEVLGDNPAEILKTLVPSYDLVLK